ncbi:FH1/FH2 domain-containing protein 1-like [Clupea harengus]|uniref:FH1/FH2 domain-containing protein 1-like n=1 Tax=Clupea harengus TaxID=7950 RepID=A0A8M1KY38_CLUHA|nr:FH1/FH2 domain-containing protein 1-like [Clupea harengus]
MKHSDFLEPDQSWASFIRPAPRLRLNTLDFSDLWDDEDLELDVQEDDTVFTSSGSDCAPPTPPLPPPLPPSAPPLPPLSPSAGPAGGGSGGRTLKLHWRELQSLPPVPRVCRFGSQTIWAGLEPVRLDTNRLEYLFESKSSAAVGTLRSLVMGRQVRIGLGTGGHQCDVM